jgi:hypothetical protein
MMYARFLLTAAIATTLASTSRAALVVEEQFNYGAPSGNVDGKNGGTGFDAAWYVPGGGTSASYNTGLTFGTLAVAGGALDTQSDASLWRNERLLSPAATTALDNAGPFGGGYWYGSFLVKKTVNDPNVGAELAIGVPGQTTTPMIGFEARRPDAGNPDDNAAAYMEFRYASSGLPITSGTTFMYLWQVEFSLHAYGSLWILTADQYDNFITGGLSASELNAAALGAGSSNVYDRIYFDANGGPGNPASINIYAPNSQVVFDEIRISTSSLTEAAPQAVPEPASLSLLALGALALLRHKRS